LEPVVESPSPPAEYGRSPRLKRVVRDSNEVRYEVPRVSLAVSLRIAVTSAHRFEFSPRGLDPRPTPSPGYTVSKTTSATTSSSAESREKRLRADPALVEEAASGLFPAMLPASQAARHLQSLDRPLPSAARTRLRHRTIPGITSPVLVCCSRSWRNRRSYRKGRRVQPNLSTKGDCMPGQHARYSALVNRAVRCVFVVSRSR